MSPHKSKILVIDDEKDIVSILNKYLTDEGYSVSTACDAKTALVEAVEIVPDLIVLDVKMPGMDGYQLKTELNLNPVTANIPVIFLSSSVSTLDKVTGLNLQAIDYMTKPFDILELLARINAVLKRHQRYEEISMKDELTGLPNANYFNKELTIAFNTAKRYGRIFTVGFIDIDRFKTINDTFGHLAGDAVLREAAKRMGKSLRNPDVLARYGGDEFCMIMREATEGQAKVALARLKKSVEEDLFQGMNGDGKFAVTISVGMATYSDRCLDAKELMALADKNMYRSKNVSSGAVKRTKVKR